MFKIGDKVLLFWEAEDNETPAYYREAIIEEIGASSYYGTDVKVYFGDLDYSETLNTEDEFIFCIEHVFSDSIVKYKLRDERGIGYYLIDRNDYMSQIFSMSDVQDIINTIAVYEEDNYEV